MTKIDNFVDKDNNKDQTNENNEMEAAPPTLQCFINTKSPTNGDVMNDVVMNDVEMNDVEMKQVPVQETT